MLTTITGCSTSGIWLTRSLLSAIRPRPISVMMMTIAATGRLMLKSERNIAVSRSGAGGDRRGGRARRGHLEALAVGERGARGAQHAVARGDARGDHHVAQARVALAQL